MPTPFPGMDPYLERPDLWPNVHSSLMVALRDDLAPRLRPRYYVSVEERTYLVQPNEASFGARPDIAVVSESQVAYEVTAVAEAPPRVATVLLPMPDVVRERYLEIRAVENDRVVTVVEILSPTNKQPGKGRRLYERKRLALMATRTHLVEIDLLRGGEPLPVVGAGQRSHYRLLISREEKRPFAELISFSVRQAIPSFTLPLLPDDEEPEVELGRLFHELYDRAGYDLRIDYKGAAEPPLEGEDAAWATGLLQQADLRESATSG